MGSRPFPKPWSCHCLLQKKIGSKTHGYAYGYAYACVYADAYAFGYAYAYGYACGYAYAYGYGYDCDCSCAIEWGPVPLRGPGHALAYYKKVSEAKHMAMPMAMLLHMAMAMAGTIHLKSCGVLSLPEALVMLLLITTRCGQ